MTFRRLAPLLVLLLLALVPTGASQAASSDGAVTAKKRPPKCKVGTSKHKCRCPKGYKVKKGRNKKGERTYRCKKIPKPPPADVDQPTDPGTGPVTDPGTDPGTGPVTDPGTDPGTDPAVPPTGAGGERNDQALVDALLGAAARKYESSGGYSIYTYNFMPTELTEANGIKFYNLRYCTFSSYVGFGNSRDNYNGAWGVKEGFRRTDHPEYPGLVSGVVYLYREGMPQEQVVEAAVAIYQGNASINVGSGSTYFTGGDFSFKPGQATTDCAQWEE